MESYALALGLTLAIEMPIVLAFASHAVRRRTLLDALLVNLFTHSLGWLAVQHFGVPWLVVEMLVALTEAVVYAKVTGLSAPRAAALTANGRTATLALLCLSADTAGRRRTAGTWGRLRPVHHSGGPLPTRRR